MVGDFYFVLLVAAVVAADRLGVILIAKKVGYVWKFLSGNKWKTNDKFVVVPSEDRFLIPSPSLAGPIPSSKGSIGLLLRMVSLAAAALSPLSISSFLEHQMHLTPIAIRELNRQCISSSKTHSSIRYLLFEVRHISQPLHNPISAEFRV